MRAPSYVDRVVTIARAPSGYDRTMSAPIELEPLAATRTWFITGISRGLGKALAEHVLAQGERVVGTVRDGGDAFAHDRLEVVELDVTDAGTVTREIDAAWARHGAVDVVVNNAGYGVLGAIEEVSDAEIRRVFETNVFGLLSVTRAALPHVREQGFGLFINMSSVGGLVTFPGYGIYNGTKYAVEGLSGALAAEIGPFGGRVMIVEPGPFRTDFLEARSLHSTGRIEAYEPSVGKTRAAAAARAGHQPGDPARAADVIYAASLEARPPLHLVLGRPAIDLVRRGFAGTERDIAAWQARSEATAFPEPARA